MDEKTCDKCGNKSEAEDIMDEAFTGFKDEDVKEPVVKRSELDEFLGV